jgi:hypothetical protein
MNITKGFRAHAACIDNECCVPCRSRHSTHSCLPESANGQARSSLTQARSNRPFKFADSGPEAADCHDQVPVTMLSEERNSPLSSKPRPSPFASKNELGHWAGPSGRFLYHPAHVPAPHYAIRYLFKISYAFRAVPAIAKKKNYYFKLLQKIGRTGGRAKVPAKPPKDKDKEGDKATKEQIERENGAERRLEARAISQSIKDNDGLSAAAVAGTAAAASIRGQGSKSKDLSAVGSPQRKDRSEDEKIC